MELVTAAGLALVCCGCFWGVWNCVCVKKGIPFGGVKGRSLFEGLLPVFVGMFVVFCGGVLGYGRARWVMRVERECRVWELDGRYGVCTGAVETVARKGERWEVVVRVEGMGAERNDGERVELAGAGQGAEDGANLAQSARTPGRILVYLKGETRPRLGSRIAAEGRLRVFDEARNPGVFDFREYYRSRNLYCRMTAEKWEELEGDGWDGWLRERLFAAAERAGKVLDAAAEPEAAGIWKAALLGDRSGMDEDLTALYRRSGIAHLLAISGLHLSLMSMAVYGLLRKMGFGFGSAGLTGGVVLILYGCMTGMGMSVRRALVMALCGYLAAYLGRRYDLLSALSLAGILLLWDNPWALTQAGVQLSFGAVLGIGWAAGRLMEDSMDLGAVAEKSRGNPREGETVSGTSGAAGSGKSGKSALLVQTLSASVGMQLVTLPLILYHYFELPLYGMVLNLLVVPFMGIVLASGAAGILLGSVHLGAGRFALGSGQAVLALYKQLCRWFALLPWANLIVGQPELWQIGAYYGALAACLYFRRAGGRKGKGRWWVLLLAVLLIPLPVRGMEVTFLDVGQGDGICIETASGVLLVDGGSSDESHLGENTLEPFLKSRGIRAVDYAVVSHGDADHMNGLMELLQPGRDIQIRCLVLPAVGAGDEVYSQLAGLADEHGAEVVWMGTGDGLRLGALAVECLYPDQPSADRNEHSLVLRASYGNFRMLLTGDMSAEGERALLAEAGAAQPVHVLKVAHHGSKTATSPAWLDALHPTWAVISSGRDNRYGHPHQEVVDALRERGIVVWNTQESGAVRLWTDGERVSWEGFCGVP